MTHLIRQDEIDAYADAIEALGIEALGIEFLPEDVPALCLRVAGSLDERLQRP